MTGLMMKDALVMRKTLRLYALFLLFYSGLAVLGVFPMSMALAMVEVIVMVLPISSFSYDEAAKWDRYAAVLPVGRTAVVKGPVSLPAAGAAGGGGHRAGGEHPGLPAGTGGSGGAAGHPAGLYGFGADDRGHYAAGGLSAGAGAGPALDVCSHFCPYRGAAGGAKLGLFDGIDLVLLDQLPELAVLGVFALVPLVPLVGMLLSCWISCRIYARKEF